MNKKHGVIIILLGVLAGLHPDAPRAQDVSPADIEAVRETTNKLIEQLVQSGILTREKAQALQDEARKSAQQKAPAGGKDAVVRVPYVPKAVRDQIKQELRSEVESTARAEGWGRPAAYPAWLERFKFYGEMRLRLQRNQLDAGNAQRFYLNVQDSNNGAGDRFLNTTQGDTLWRYRLRFGTDVTLSDWARVGLRMSTGNPGDPVTGNQTLGTTFNKSSFALDRAYLRLEPRPWATLTGGRIANPFMGSDLLWDDDLSFEGASLTLKSTGTQGLRPFGVIGGFPLEKVSCANFEVRSACGRDKWLYAFQAGVETNITAKARLKVGASYYHYKNVEGVLNDPLENIDNRGAVPKFVQKGNTTFNVVTAAGQNPLYGLAPKFQLLNLTGQLELTHTDPYRFALMADYVKNIGYDREEIRVRTGGLVDREARTTGYQLRLGFGHPGTSARGQWQAFGGYKYLERDAVLDAFTDSNFHLGGTDARGWILGGSYALGDKVQLRGRWFSANEIDGPALAIDVFQLDLTAEF